LDDDRGRVRARGAFYRDLGDLFGQRDFQAEPAVHDPIFFVYDQGVIDPALLDVAGHRDDQLGIGLGNLLEERVKPEGRWIDDFDFHESGKQELRKGDFRNARQSREGSGAERGSAKHENRKGIFHRAEESAEFAACGAPAWP
jgi:hypothetical protein